jgi:hypothetical protein
MPRRNIAANKKIRDNDCRLHKIRVRIRRRVVKINRKGRGIVKNLPTTIPDGKSIAIIISGRFIYTSLDNYTII